MARRELCQLTAVADSWIGCLGGDIIAVLILLGVAVTSLLAAYNLDAANSGGTISDDDTDAINAGGGTLSSAAAAAAAASKIDPTTTILSWWSVLSPLITALAISTYLFLIINVRALNALRNQHAELVRPHIAYTLIQLLLLFTSVGMLGQVLSNGTEMARAAPVVAAPLLICFCIAMLRDYKSPTEEDDRAE